MKKKIIYFLFLLAVVFPVALSAQDRAVQLLDRMRETMQSLGNYEAAFLISSGDEQLLGSFAVEGECYRIEMADMEVLGEASARYEINKPRKEVTIMQTDASSADILSNPAHAFELVGSQYRPVLLAEGEESATLSLQNEADPGTTIRLEIDTRTYRPATIVYVMGGLELQIKIVALSALQQPLPRFDAAAYAEYELIDFR